MAETPDPNWGIPPKQNKTRFNDFLKDGAVFGYDAKVRIRNGYYEALRSEGNPRLAYRSDDFSEFIEDVLADEDIFTVCMRNGIYPVTKTLVVPSYKSIDGSGKGWGDINRTTFVSTSYQKGTVLHGEEYANIDNIMQISLNSNIRNLSIEGYATNGLYQYGGGNCVVDISVIPDRTDTETSTIDTGIYSTGPAGGYNKFSGHIYGGRRGVYANNDWMIVENFRIAEPLEIGFEKGPDTVNVVFINCGVSDYLVSSPLTPSSFLVSQPRHLTMIRCTSELYNPSAYHLKYTDYPPTIIEDLVSCYDCQFYGGAKRDMTRVMWHQKGIPHYPKGYGPSFKSDPITSTDDTGIVMYENPAQEIVICNPHSSSKPTLKIIRASASFIFSKGIRIKPDGINNSYIIPDDGVIVNKFASRAVPIPEGAYDQIITFPQISNAPYAVIVAPSWLTTWRCSDFTLSTFKVFFGTPAPSGAHISFFIFRDLSQYEGW